MKLYARSLLDVIRVSPNGRVPEATAVSYAIQLFTALAELKEARIVSRVRQQSFPGFGFELVIICITGRQARKHVAGRVWWVVSRRSWHRTRHDRDSELCLRKHHGCDSFEGVVGIVVSRRCRLVTAF